MIESHGLAIGEDADHIVTVSNHFARIAIERNEVFALAIGIGLMHHAHGLQLPGMRVDEGALVVQPRDRIGHARELAERILVGRYGLWCQDQQEAGCERVQGHGSA
jgi:hypothetical protein